MGALLYGLATIPRVSWLHDLGTALFVTGLSLIVSTASGKEAVRQQHAKDANIDRKDKIYAPLYVELKQLWERFEDASKGEGSYPHWIQGLGEVPTYTQLMPYAVHLPFPGFTRWPDFKSDHRINDFTPIARELLNELQQHVVAYNTAIAATEEPNADVLTPYLTSAVDTILKSPGYQEWQQQVQAGTRVRGDIDSWYERIKRLCDNSSALFAQEAEVWLNNFGARGWLLAGNLDEAVSSVRENYHHISVPTPPPQAWFREIFQLAWPEINELPVNQQARLVASALLKKVREAKDHFEEGFLYIRDNYEGGNPPI